MSKFSKEELIRYNRQMMLPEIGLKGQEKLKNAKVLVVGAGGLGCPALQYMNAAGVGTLGIIDFDKIELHNLHRQILFSKEDIGRSKTNAAFDKLKQQNENTKFILFDEMLTENNADNIISQFDIVVDGSDNFLTRYLVNDTCVQLNKTCIYGSILRSEGQVAVFNYKGSKNLRDIYPEPPDPEDVPNCDENGVIGMVPGIIGTYMALKTIFVILETIKDPDQLQLIDLYSSAQTLVNF
ncbi:MAG: HesA/MoeB/ThiF family protein [Bacteroidia bacterium]